MIMCSTVALRRTDCFVSEAAHPKVRPAAGGDVGSWPAGELNGRAGADLQHVGP